MRLSVNGKLIAAKKPLECPMATCEFKDVLLQPGENTVTAEGRYAGKSVRDTVHWNFESDGVHIAAGRLATGYIAADGRRFGSDNFFLGGEGKKLEREKETQMGPESLAGAGATRFAGTEDLLLYQHYRVGRFAYAIPLDNGRYQVTLGFIEPDTGTASGGRVFTVLANGKPQLQGFDVLAAANGDHERAVTRRFAVDVTNGRLQLDFLPSQGEAVVSSISIRRQ